MPPRTKKVAAIHDAGDLGALAMRQTAIVKLTDPRFPGENRDTGYRVEIESLYSAAAHDVITGARAPLKIVDDKVDAAQTSFTDTLPEQVIAVTRRWWKEGVSTDTITLHGEEMQASPANVRKVYENPEFAWIQRQVQGAYLNLAGFFDTPKTA